MAVSAVLEISASAGLFVPSAAGGYDASEFQQTADVFFTSQIPLSSFMWKFIMIVKTQGKSTSEGFCFQAIFTTMKYNTTDECPWLRMEFVFLVDQFQPTWEQHACISGKHVI